MKKFIIPLLVLGIFSCTSNAPIKNSNLPTSTNKVENLNVTKSQAEVRFSFSIKDVASTSRVKSVDIYLVDASGLSDPTNVYIQKKQVDVVDGVISTGFTNVPSGGPYYAVIQAFDNLVSPTPEPSTSAIPERMNITAPNPSASSFPIDISSNTVNSSGSSLTYSTDDKLNVVIHLVPYNNANTNVGIQDGSNTPTGSIVPTEVTPTPSVSPTPPLG